MWNTWFKDSRETLGCDSSGGYLRLAQVQGLSDDRHGTGGPPRLIVAEREIPQLPDGDPGYAAVVGGLLRDMRRAAPFRARES